MSRRHCGGRYGGLVADMEVHMVANMEVDKVANKVADMVTWLPPWWPQKIDIYMEIQFGESWSGGLANWVCPETFRPETFCVRTYFCPATYCPGKILY